jgi:four helix bundle protein
MSYHSFEDLEVWKRGCQLSVDVYELFRGSKEFAFRDQMIRSSLSIPSNIAEGAERGSNADFIRFLHYSKGSSAELRTHAHIAERLRLISDEAAQSVVRESRELSAMLHSLLGRLGSGS